MRVPVYIVCAALVVAVKSEEKPNFFGKLLEPSQSLQEQENLRFLLPKLAARYRVNGEWNGMADPRFYLFPDMDTNEIDSQKNSRNKRYEYRRSANPSLSIVAPIQTLRDAMQQARMRSQIERNREFLQNLSSE